MIRRHLANTFLKLSLNSLYRTGLPLFSPFYIVNRLNKAASTADMDF